MSREVPVRFREGLGVRLPRATRLAFSGGRDFARSAQRFCVHVAATAAEQGFDVCYRKTRVMHQSVRQQLAGIVVNQQLNVRRQEYDRLKATLVNCIRHGAATQNRDGNDDFRAYLLGKISFVAMINPHRGQRLRTLFERIKW